MPWFVQQLGTELHRRATEKRASLTDCLADSIRHVGQLHGLICDLNNPMTPTATVVAVRVRAESLEWLALSDSTIVISGTSELQTIADHRVSDVTTKQRVDMDASLQELSEADRRRRLVYAQREIMNTTDRYWVAAHEPKAAEEALTGWTHVSDITAVALLTDGAARHVDDFHEMTWPEAMRHLEAEGPQGLIDRTRRMEHADPDAERWPRSKRHDDATAVLIRF
ncbi:hypothetical protein [Streptomyces sp. NPDC001970]